MLLQNQLSHSLYNVFLSGCFCVCIVLSSPGNAQDENGLWNVYESFLKNAKYVDLTHSFAPVQPVWEGDAPAVFKAGTAGTDIPGYVQKGQEYTYEKHHFVITHYDLPTDHYGTQLDPPGHWHPFGATISDLPATYTLRPLVVIDIHRKVERDNGYHLQVSDILDWEAKNGLIPEGSVVMVRTDWYLLWNDIERFKKKPFPGVSLEAVKFLHLERKILFHGHEPLDCDTTETFEAEDWILNNNFCQAEGVANLDKLPEKGALISIGFAKPQGGTGGFARFIAVCPPEWQYGETLETNPGAPLPIQKFPLKRDEHGVMRAKEE